MTQTYNPSEAVREFIMHCGQMSSQWGFNKTVGQMLGLLIMHPEPLNADELTEILCVSRSNVSTALKELQSWRLVSTHSPPGDRKDYFTASGSLWDMASTVLEERRKRELDPTLSLLNRRLAEPLIEADAYAHTRMQEMHDVLSLLSQCSSNLQGLNADNLQTLIRMGANMNKLLALKDKFFDR